MVVFCHICVLSFLFCYLHVDQFSTGNNLTSLKEKIAAIPKESWTSLKCLKLGGHFPSGDVILFLLNGCDSIQTFSLSLFESLSEVFHDDLLEQMLIINPFKDLTTFHVKKCNLTNRSFFLLINSLPHLRLVGDLSEWFGLDRRSKLCIAEFVKLNNLALDITYNAIND